MDLPVCSFLSLVGIACNADGCRPLEAFFSPDSRDSSAIGVTSIASHLYGSKSFGSNTRLRSKKFLTSPLNERSNFLR